MVESTQHEQRAARPPQYLAAFSATLGALAVGACLGYSSPAGLQLTREANNSNISISNNSIHEVLDVLLFDENLKLSGAEMAWVSSIISLGALWGGLVGGSTLNYFGRRGTMIISVMPATVGWLLIALAVNMSMMCAGRLATGVFVGLACISINTYIGEFSSPDIRGTLGMGWQLMVNFGFLWSYSFGVVLTWYYLALVCGTVPIIFAVTMFFNQESPAYLLSKGRDNEAKAALKYFRGAHYPLEPELLAMRISLERTQHDKMSLGDFCNTVYIMRPLLSLVGLMFFQQFSGANAVLFNLSLIFKSAGTDLSESLSSIIIGGVFVLGTLAGSLLIDRMGRKPLLVFSALLMCISEVALGYFFYQLENHKDWALLQLQWLPLLSLIIWMLGFAIGFAPIPWIMMGEMFSPDAREVASSITTASNWFFSFIVTITFEPLQSLLNNSGVFWLFAAVNMASALFCTLVLKETKGKSLAQITTMFGGPSGVSANGDEVTTNQLLEERGSLVGNQLMRSK